MSSGHQTIVIGYPERIYFRFEDDDCNLINVSTAQVRIYDPDKNLVISDAALSNESTGIYYYYFNLSSALSTATGMYQAWPRGTYGGVMVSMNEPRYIEVVAEAMGTGRDYEFLQSVRRFVGDTDASDYRISTGELAGFVKDGLEAVQSKYREYTGITLDYTVQTSNQGVVFNEELTDTVSHLIKCQVTILLMGHYLQINLSQPGIINAGDVRISNNSQAKHLIKKIADDRARLEKEIKTVILQGIGASILYSFGDGSTNYSGYWHY